MLQKNEIATMGDLPWVSCMFKWNSHYKN